MLLLVLRIANIKRIEWAVLSSASPTLSNGVRVLYEYSTDTCIALIAQKRHVSVDEALELRRRALTLYANERLSEFPLKTGTHRQSRVSRPMGSSGPDETIVTRIGRHASLKAADVCALY